LVPLVAEADESIEDVSKGLNNAVSRFRAIGAASPRGPFAKRDFARDFR